MSKSRTAERRYRHTQVSDIRTLGYRGCPDGLPIGVATLRPALHYVEAPLGWCATTAHNLYSAAVLTAMASAVEASTK